MLYRHYHIQYTTNDDGEYRWIIDDTACASDERGRQGFKTLDEAKRYVNKLMKDQGKANEGFHSIYPDDYYVKD